MKNKIISNILDEMIEKKELSRKIDNSKAFMPFNIDYLYYDDNYKCERFAFSHYYKQNGDMIADPDMEILFDREVKELYGVTYQDSFGYQKAETAKTTGKLTNFLVKWLKNVIEQQGLL